MTTLTLFTVAVLALIVGILLFRIIPAMQTYFMYRGKRLVTCPETLEPEAVDVAARKAAAWTFVGSLLFVWIEAHVGRDVRTAVRSA